MILKNAMILWNVDTFQVCVVDRDTYVRSEWLNRQYPSSGGCCWTHVKDLNQDQSVRFIYVVAIHLIVRDKIPFMTVHNAFCAIDEYRDSLAVDMPVGTNCSDLDISRECGPYRVPEKQIVRSESI